MEWCLRVLIDAPTSYIQTRVLHALVCRPRVRMPGRRQGKSTSKNPPLRYNHIIPLIWPHLKKAMEHLVDPVTCSPSLNKKVIGVLCLHVDDLFVSGNDEFHRRVVEGLRHDFQVGSEDKNDIMCVGQRIRWISMENPDLILEWIRTCALMNLRKLPLKRVSPMQLPVHLGSTRSTGAS